MVTDRGIHAVCTQGHEQRLYTPDMPAGEARSLAGLMDGTHPLYQYPPREHPLPESVVGRCGICGAWLTCTLFGYDEEPTP
jgi:hypothetical protein